MAQDFAKGKKGKRSSKSSAGKRQSASSGSRGRGLRLYLGGVLTGLFISFIGYLALLPDPGAPQDTANQPPEAEAPKPRFDFYTLLPEQTIELEEEAVEPAADISQPTASAPVEQYMLQAGSFRQEEDAKRRRAELLLLGLQPKVVEAQGDSGRVYRVFVGPFSSLEKVSSARGLTAGENIETLLLKRSEP